MPVSLNTRAFGLLWNWWLESLFGLLTDSMEPHTVLGLFHFKNGPLRARGTVHTLHESCFFRFWRDTDPENNFFWGQVISIFTPSSHWELFISVCCPTTCQTDVMNNFFRTNIIQKEFNLLQMEQVDLWLHPLLVCERFLVLQCSLTSQLGANLTSSQIYKHILALKEFSQTTCICLFSKKAFQFELLFYCLLFPKLLLWILTCLTWAQPSHTYTKWTNHEMCTAYQKWSCISLWLWWISEWAFVH